MRGNRGREKEEIGGGKERKGRVRGKKGGKETKKEGGGKGGEK